MRAPLVLVLTVTLVALSAGRLAWATGDPAAVATVVLPDEDDPKLARPAPTRARWPKITHHVPRLKLGYRYLSAASLEGGSQPFHAATLDYYPVSNLFRVGISTELAFAGDAYGMWYLTEGLTVGIQWPARVTPFLDGRFGAGLIGATVLGRSAVSYVYGGGLDAGIEVYCVRRFYLTAAVGWVHPVYSGVDVNALKAKPTTLPPRKDFAADSFTVKVGIGL